MNIEKKIYRWKDLRKILKGKGVTFEHSSRGMKFKRGEKICTIHFKRALTPNMEVTKDYIENMIKYL